MNRNNGMWTRRNLLKTLSTAGAIGIAGCSGTSGSSESGGSSSGESFSMTLAGPYTQDAMDNYAPMMFQTYKSEIESRSDGRISVDLASGGELGAGTELAQKTQQGTVEAAQFSLSNFSPFAPAVDLINLPYFAGTNQKFVNLITSDVWQNNIHQKVRDNGYRIGYYALVDPRSIAPGPEFPNEIPPRTPSGMEGVTHRIPGSDIIQLAWDLVGANPSPVNWGETPQALQEGVAGSTHNALEFHPAFGFTDIIEAEVLIKAVEDAQAIALNKEWYDSLPSDLQTAVDKAGQVAFQANLDSLSEYRQRSIEELRGSDVEIVELPDSELSQWKEVMGYQRSEYDDFKQELAGDMETFQKFEEATTQQSDYDVSPQSL